LISKSVYANEFIPVGSLSNGLYLAKITTSTGVIKIKIQKK